MNLLNVQSQIDGRLVRSKREAVSVIVEHNLQADSVIGMGSKARRRMKRLGLYQISFMEAQELTWTETIDEEQRQTARENFECEMTARSEGRE